MMSKSIMKRLETQIPELAEIIKKNYVPREKFEIQAKALRVALMELESTAESGPHTQAQNALSVLIEINEILGEK